MEIKGFLETSFVDWADKICSVLFLPYCNFRCPYCHNHELILSPDRFETLDWDVIRGRLQSLAGWLDGVCVTGGEPTLHPDLPNLLTAIKALGLPVKLDTNGTRPQVLRFLVTEGLVDFVAMDIKGPLEPEQVQPLRRRPGEIWARSGSPSIFCCPGPLPTSFGPPWSPGSILRK